MTKEENAVLHANKLWWAACDAYILAVVRDVGPDLAAVKKVIQKSKVRSIINAAMIKDAIEQHLKK